MSQTTRHTLLGVVEESSAGTTPASALQLINVAAIPVPSRDRSVEAPGILSNDLNNYPSQVLQSDGSWAIPATPLQFRNMLNFWEGIYGNDEGSDISISGTGISASSNVVSDTGNGLATILSGDMVYMTDGNSGADFTSAWFGPVTNGATAGSFTLPAGQMPDFTAGNTVTIDTRRLTASDSTKTYSIETQYTKLTTHFLSSVYNIVDNMTWAWSQGAFATEAATLRGQQVSQGTATIGTGAATAALTTDYMNSVGNVADTTGTGEVWISTTAGTNLAASIIVSDWSLSFGRQNGVGRGIGNAGFTDACLGAIDATLDCTFILDDNSKALTTGFEAHSTYEIHWSVKDSQGNRICWLLPACKPVNQPLGQNDNRYTRSMQFRTHDPAKDSGSTYASSSFGFELAMFYAAA